jgi:hypothetical protein
MTGIRAFALLMVVIASSASAQPSERPVGSVYFECATTVHFFLPGPDGGVPSFKFPLKPKRPVQVWDRAVAGPERIDASAILAPDGAISSLHMYWMQSGLIGWPQVGRADLDDLVLYIRFGGSRDQASLAKSAGSLGRFDPTLLSVEVSALETRSMKRPRLLTLRRSMGDTEQLGGLAEIPPWLKSASIHLPWTELSRFANGQPKLTFFIQEIVFRDGQFYHDGVRSGVLDLTVMPRVIEQFQEAERQLKLKAANAQSQCRQAKVQPQEIDPHAEI